MPINPVSLIAGALSFSAALSWNKAIHESLDNIAGYHTSAITHAIVVTMIIIITVLIINGGLRLYTYYTNKPLNKSTLTHGNMNNKVKLIL